MDSQHRHELQQNELGKLTNQALPFLEKYGMQLVIALAAVVVVGAGAAWWYGESNISTAASWTQLEGTLFQSNPSADDFASVADKHPGSVAAAWAKLKEADDYLKSGMQAVFTDREAALADLKKAQEGYQKLDAGGAGIIPDVRERALFGLARCLETMSDGKSDAAIDAYRRLIEQFPDSMFRTIAQNRIKELESPEAREFYAWFHEQKPKPKDVQPFPFRKPAGGEGATKRSDDKSESNEGSASGGSSGSPPESDQKPSESPGDSPAP